MLKKLTTVLAMLLMFSAASYAQWTYDGVFPPMEDDTLMGTNHGMAVDGEGKIWAVNYYHMGEVETAEGDTISALGIQVYWPDGTPADFSPLNVIDFGTETDTLVGNGRGMRADNDGNIIVTLSGMGEGANVFKIDYKTGEGLAKVNYPTSPTAPAVDEFNNIYVGPVVPGNPITIYDTDLNELQNAVEATPAGHFSRTLEVSSDGNTIYFPGYPRDTTTVYTRADEFSDFEITDHILLGMAAESMGWNPKSGALWASGGSYNDLPSEGYTPNTWYAYSIAEDAVIDSFKWDFTEPGSANERPRAIAFSHSGDTAYVGAFGTNSIPMIQRFIRNTDPVSVTFKVNMSVAIENEDFDPANDVMHIAGSFNDWSTTATEMTDANSDNIYEVTVGDLEPGTNLGFKYVINTDGWESIDDRKYIVRGEDTEFEAYYNNDLGGGIDIWLSFSVDMELEKVSGRFDPDNDTLSVRGTFNGWSSDDIMAPAPGDPNTYTLDVQASALAGDVISYKFAYITGGETTWENGDDYKYTVTQEDINAGFATISRAFNNVGLESVTAQPTTITFQVNMEGAVNQEGTAFTAINNVIIAGAVKPLAWPQGGWPDADSTVVHYLNDNGTDGDSVAGDMWWSTELTFPKYTILSFYYKYGANWARETNLGTNDNESSTGVDHQLVMQRGLVSAKLRDDFGDMSKAVLYSTVVGVDDERVATPNSYSLDQNFPNPFNPATTITFSLKESAHVTLKVYDVLGREVATLINEERPAGQQPPINFNAANLASGMYIYTIQAGEFTATKKMMLLK